MRDIAKAKAAWWVGGAMLFGIGLAVHRLLKFDIDLDLDWDNLPI